ncbi:aminoacyl-tRNA hydrolase [Candidatus Woesebacteria bacterium GWA1_41_8]|jgi:PTH1 family peptidyl-tRNA hydrolase|uniref:Peptidyl-tRNA hydrolase n=1 Tax=Candidatus Woesebacteria bacterium GWA1_41_8 TaxID=1802471 RepID=A0A1F7WGK3_9BACT|nr:MAG: aminoacyl-tRNA hydrolase [Candidatus Woesebacteria bacterium GWA1_41_8]
MHLIVGLGNPGERYEDTRHNVGFMVLDELAKAMNLPDWQLVKKFKSELVDKKPVAVLVKPQTFMNDSGVAVSKLATFYKLSATDIFVVHDDLDIRLGEYKMQKGIGPRLHYGVQSIEEKLGRKDFWRVRVGVDYRGSENRIAGEDYVLQNFYEKEVLIVDNVVDRIVNELTNRLGINVAIN